MTSTAEPINSFYSKLGRPKLVVAPMVGHSELSYRMQTRKHGAQLVYTQMFNSNSFIQSKEYRLENFSTCPDDRPLICQFAGHDPDIILQAAKLVEDQCDAIDLNLGCPQGIAKRGRYGAFLMEELSLLTNIVSTLSKGLKVPVTCKTRIYKDFDASIRLCETLVLAGASLLAIHGRTRDEKGNNTGPVDWDMIKRIKSHFGSRVPIFANGGIENMKDLCACLHHTGCDGVMVSEAILENPAFFTESVYCGVSKSQVDLAEEYLQLTSVYPTPVTCIRSHFLKLLHRYLTIHVDLRKRTAEARSVEDFYDICNEVRQCVDAACAESEDESVQYPESWYRRHRRQESQQLSSNITRSDAVRNYQQLNIHSKPKLWDNLGESEVGVFDCLGMFGAYHEE